MSTATNDQAISKLKTWATAKGTAVEKQRVTFLIDQWSNDLGIRIKFNGSFSDYLAAENAQAKRAGAVIESRKDYR